MGEQLGQQWRYKQESALYILVFHPYPVTQLQTTKDMAAAAEIQLFASLKGHVQSQHHTILSRCHEAITLTRFQHLQIWRIL